LIIVLALQEIRFDDSLLHIIGHHIQLFHQRKLLFGLFLQTHLHQARLLFLPHLRQSQASAFIRLQVASEYRLDVADVLVEDDHVLFDIVDVCCVFQELLEHPLPSLLLDFLHHDGSI